MFDWIGRHVLLGVVVGMVFWLASCASGVKKDPVVVPIPQKEIVTDKITPAERKLCKDAMDDATKALPDYRKDTQRDWITYSDKLKFAMNVCGKIVDNH